MTAVVLHALFAGCINSSVSVAMQELDFSRKPKTKTDTPYACMHERESCITTLQGKVLPNWYAWWADAWAGTVYAYYLGVLSSILSILYI